MLSHVMLDLETWGVTPYSTIISIGACEFNPYSEDPEQIIMERFEVAVDPTTFHGLRADPKTILWWMNAGRDEARKAWLGKPMLDLPVVLDSFTDWLHSLVAIPGDLRIWGNGSDFDNALLAQAYEVTKRELPWGFRNNRCFRTLKSLSAFVALDETEGPPPPAAHTALADAENQAIRAHHIVRKLGIKLT